MDGWELLISVGTVLAVFAVLMLLLLLLIWAERRIAGLMQVRLGPNRAGPFGLLVTLADGIKLFFKESIRPRRIDVFAYELAPVLAMIPAFLAFSIIPFGPGFTIGDYEVKMQVADLNVGILWFLAMSAVAVYSSLLAGWSSGSKYPLLGGIRASAQVISYEAAMSLAIVPVVIAAGTLNLNGIVLAQSEWRWFFLPLIVPFIAFFISGVAETNRPPFDMVEAESELVGGFHTEYSGIRFALFFLAEYVNIVTICALTTTLFLGGWLGPNFTTIPALSGFLWFLIKTLLLLFVFIWLRVSLPRMRYDLLMQFGWKRLVPINIAYTMLVAGWIAFQERGDLPALIGSAAGAAAGR